MSGIDIVDLSVLTEKDMQIALDQTESMARSNPVRNIDEIVLSLTAEIRRLRAQNKELRDNDAARIEAEQLQSMIDAAR